MHPSCLGLSVLPALACLFPFTKLGKLAFTIFSNTVPISCFFYSPSGTPRILDLLKLSQKLFILYAFFWILFSSRFSSLLFFASLCSKSLIRFLVSSTLLLFPSKLLFQLVYPLFLTGYFYAAEVLTKFLEHPYNQCSELCF